MEYRDSSVRAKVVKKSKGKEQYYGRVGTVRESSSVAVRLRFYEGREEVFEKHELRMGVKASD